MKIDFVSDVSCPWCAVGLYSLEAALTRLSDEVKVEIHCQPFELNPQMPPEGQNLAEHIAEKYGSSPEQLERNREVLRMRGAEVGFTFNFTDSSRIYNTFDAHRLLHWAGLEGRQLLLKQALLKAYFTNGQNISLPEVLIQVSGEVGLDTGKVREILVSNAYSEEVRQRQAFYRQCGIEAVPSVIINDLHLIQGGQAADVFERVLRDLAASEAKPPAPSA